MAERWGFRPETLANWERGILRPSTKAWPWIIELLGLDPLAAEDSLGGRLEAARRRLGLTRREFAGRVGLDEGSICAWARGRRTPSPGMAPRIQAILEQLSGSSRKPDLPASSYFDQSRWRRTAPEGAHPKTLGERLRARRLRLGLSQFSVGTVFGVSRGTIHRWESNRKRPGRKLTAEVLKWLNEQQPSQRPASDPC